MTKKREANLEIERLEALALDDAQPLDARFAAVQQLGDVVDAAGKVVDAAEDSDDRPDDESVRQAVATLIDGAAALRRVAFANTRKPRGPDAQ